LISTGISTRWPTLLGPGYYTQATTTQRLYIRVSRLISVLL
jgi:hypothetical protein